MRWFLGLVLVVALLMGAAYGVGRFLLPNTLEVTRTVSIERPRASVFAMINDLRIAQQWSPYYAKDPQAEFTFSGPPGAGQTMRWVSSLRDVGQGRISIVNSTLNRGIDSIIELGDRATLNSRIELSQTPSGSAVSWRVSAFCAEGWINVPCRYMNQVLSGRIQADLDSGLARLKTLAEQLPNVDFEGFEIEPVPVAAQDVLFVDVSIANPNATFADHATVEAAGVRRLREYFAEFGLQAPDELIRVYRAPEGGVLSFSVGYAYTGPAPLSLVGVRVGRTPGGQALQGQYSGRRSQIQAMYNRMDTYLQAHRIASRPDAERWEIVDLSSVRESAFPGDPIETAKIYFPISGD